MEGDDIEQPDQIIPPLPVDNKIQGNRTDKWWAHKHDNTQDHIYIDHPSFLHRKEKWPCPNFVHLQETKSIHFVGQNPLSLDNRTVQ